MENTDRILRRVKLRDLRLLTAVVQLGSMSKAARQFSVSQPVISKAIADLEHIIGTRLLDRSPRGVEPTPHGRALLKRAVAVFDELRAGFRDIEFLNDPTTGEIRIGSSETMSAGFLPAVIERMSRRYPRIQFRVDRIGINEERFALLHEREIDLAIGRIRVPLDDEQLKTEILFFDKLHVVAGVGNPWLKRRHIELSELSNEPWIRASAGEWEGSLVAENLRAKGLSVPPIAVGSVSSILSDSLLATGRFIGIGSASVLFYAGKRRSQKALAVDLPGERRPTGIVTLKNRTLGPAAQLFIDYARKVARAMNAS